MASDCVSPPCLAGYVDGSAVYQYIPTGISKVEVIVTTLLVITLIVLYLGGQYYGE